MVTGILIISSLGLLAVGLTALTIIEKRHGLRMRAISDIQLPKTSQRALFGSYLVIGVGLLALSLVIPSAIAFDSFGVTIASLGLYVFGLVVSVACLLAAFDLLSKLLLGYPVIRRTVQGARELKTRLLVWQIRREAEKG